MAGEGAWTGCGPSVFVCSALGLSGGAGELDPPFVIHFRASDHSDFLSIQL